MKVWNKYKHLGENSKIVIKNVFESFVVKGLSLIVSFATTPLFIKYFNDNMVLGVWYTLLSVLIWFLNFDLGLGNGIRNNLVKAFTANDTDKAKRVISSGMFSVGIVTIVMSVIGIILVYSMNLNKLFNIDTSIISSHTLLLATLFIFIAIMLRFFLTTISSIFYALQKSAINNALALCVSILQLIFIVIAKFDSPEEALLNVSFAYIFLSNLPVIVAGIIVFCGKLKDCRPSIKFVDKSNIKAIMGIGALFFICQILYMIIANTNEFFITNLYGAEHTAEYTFYYKLSTIGTMIISLALTPIWSVVTKAQSEGNYQWLGKLYGYIKIGGLCILVLQLLIVPFIPWLMRVWLGAGTVDVNYTTATAFALFSAVFLYSGMLSTIANGLAMMKTQTICYLLAVLLKFMLILVFHSKTRWDFVVWANMLILLPYIIAQQFVLNKYLKMYIRQSYTINDYENVPDGN